MPRPLGPRPQTHDRIARQSKSTSRQDARNARRAGTKSGLSRRREESLGKAFSRRGAEHAGESKGLNHEGYDGHEGVMLFVRAWPLPSISTALDSRPQTPVSRRRCATEQEPSTTEATKATEGKASRGKAGVGGTAGTASSDHDPGIVAARHTLPIEILKATIGRGTADFSLDDLFDTDVGLPLIWTGARPQYVVYPEPGWQPMISQFAMIAALSLGQFQNVLRIEPAFVTAGRPFEIIAQVTLQLCQPPTDHRLVRDGDVFSIRLTVPSCESGAKDAPIPQEFEFRGRSSGVKAGEYRVKVEIEDGGFVPMGGFIVHEALSVPFGGAATWLLAALIGIAGMLALRKAGVPSR